MMTGFSPRLVLLALLASSPAYGLQIGALLSTCVDACQRGCNEIRAVQEKRHAGEDLNVELKNEGDAKSALTEADFAAQAAICGSLRAEWGDVLTIIGEEDGDESLEERMSKMKFDPLDRNRFDDDIGETADIPIEDITIYVDPLDATREFCEGRIANCQSLVGIAIGDKAVAGVIGIPFPANDLSTESTIVYGLADVGTGVVGEPLTRGPYPLERHIDGIKYPRPHFASGDSSTKVMTAARSALVKRFGGSNVLYGGAGNKILGTALGECSASFQQKFGGPWDVCAPEAILRAMGGRITDIFGQPIALYGKDAPSSNNEKGYVATTSSSTVDHDAIIAMLLATPEVQEYRKKLGVED
jgi:3'-phosphoadenosine 5'-phosphosulfate (PAPS) 3'-phosphatase